MLNRVKLSKVYTEEYIILNILGLSLIMNR